MNALSLDLVPARTSYSRKTCGECLHWHPIAQTSNLFAIGSRPSGIGECRRRPYFFLAGNGQQMANGYGEFKKDFPACGDFEQYVAPENTSNAL